MLGEHLIHPVLLATDLGAAPWRPESFKFSTDPRYSRSAAQVNDPRSHDTSGSLLTLERGARYALV